MRSPPGALRYQYCCCRAVQHELLSRSDLFAHCVADHLAVAVSFANNDAANHHLAEQQPNNKHAELGPNNQLTVGSANPESGNKRADPEPDHLPPDAFTHPQSDPVCTLSAAGRHFGPQRLCDHRWHQSKSVFWSCLLHYLVCTHLLHGAPGRVSQRSAVWRTAELQPDPGTDSRAGGIDPSVLCAVIGHPIGRAVVGAIVERPKHRADDQHSVFFADIECSVGRAVVGAIVEPAVNKPAECNTEHFYPIDITIVATISELPNLWADFKCTI